jgi:hypothetical protein
VWVEGGDIQDELLDQLGAVLTVPDDVALTPSAAELEALAAAVTARWPGGTVAPSPAPAPVHHLRRAGSRPLRRLGSSAWRAGSAAAAIVVFSASAAAAAATGGVPLPRPVRVVAYTVGLPVDSPALDDTNHHIKDMQAAVKANDKPKAEAAARRLRTDLAKVPADEKKEAEQKVVAVMVQAAPLIQAPTPTTAPAAPSSSSTTATAPSAPGTATTVAAEEKAPVTTTTAPGGTTTTTGPEATTTTTTGPADETTSGGGTPTGGPGPGSGDPDPGGEDPSTTPTTTPQGETTTTTGPAGGGSGGDEESTTTTSGPTTTTTTPPSESGT